jgi:hypothetical protein
MAKTRAMFSAAMRGQTPLVEQLLNDGAAIDGREGLLQETVLHIAAERGDVATVQLLLTRNTAVSIKNENGDTALHLAAQRDHETVVELLILGEADVSAQNGEGKTPLHYAAKRNKPQIFELLVDAGSDIFLKDETGMIPIDYCPFTKCRLVHHKQEVRLKQLAVCMGADKRLGSESRLGPLEPELLQYISEFVRLGLKEEHDAYIRPWPI